MKITKISVKNFRALNFVEFEPKLLNVIIGDNDSGKTSLLQAISIVFDDEILSRDFADFPGSMINFEAKSSSIKVDVEQGNPSQYVVSLEIPDNEAVFEAFSRNFREFISDSNKLASDIGSNKGKKGITSDLFYFVPVPDLGYLRSNVNQSEVEERLRGCLFIKRGDPDVLIEANTYISQDVWNLGRAILAKLNQRNKENFIIQSNWEGKRKPWMRVKIKTDRGKRVYWGDTPLFIRNPGEEFKKLKKAEIEGLLNVPPFADLIKTSKELTVSQESNSLQKELQKLRTKIEEVEDEKYTDTTIIEQDQYLSTLFIGDGIKTLFGLMGTIQMARSGSVILINDADLNLSPAYLQILINYVVRWCWSEGMQLFMTVRNNDVIKCLMNKKEFESGQLAFIESEVALVKLGTLSAHERPHVLSFKEASELSG